MRVNPQKSLLNHHYGLPLLRDDVTLADGKFSYLPDREFRDRQQALADTDFERRIRSLKQILTV